MAKQEKKQEVKTEWDYVKIIGTVQIGLGIILIIACIISVFYIPSLVMEKHQTTGSRFGDVMENEGIEPDSGIMQGYMIMGMSTLEHVMLFGLLETILFVLSVMLIMQGIVNVKE